MTTLEQFRRMRRVTGLWEWDVWRADSVMQRPPDAATSTLEGDPESVLARAEPELAKEATRYRQVLVGALMMLLMPGLLAVLAWMGMYWLPVTITWLPFERGGMGLPLLSLYEWAAFLILVTYISWGAFQIHASHAACGRLSADYRRLAAATADQRTAYACAVTAGAYPRMLSVLSKSAAFEMYHELLADSSNDDASNRGDGEGAGGTAAGRLGTGSDTAETDGRSFALTSVRWLVSSSLALVLAVVAAVAVVAVLVRSIREAHLSPMAETLLLGAVLLGMYAFQMATVWGMAVAANASLSPALALRRFEARRWVPAAIGVALAARAVASGWALLLQGLDAPAPGPGLDVTRLMPPGPAGVTVIVLMVAVMAPLVEECVFRGVVYSAFLERLGAGWAAVISAAIFALLHPELYSAVPIFLFALALGELFRRSRSLWVPIIAHLTFNTLGLLGMYALKLSGLT